MSSLLSFFFLIYLGFVLRAYTLNHSTGRFMVGLFEIGACELFAGAGFDLLISASQVARIRGVSHWRLALFFFKAVFYQVAQAGP
jgi:hypothetical protein